jgi:hypothetical protein
MEHLCRQCQRPTNRMPQAVYCFDCARARNRTRQAAADRVRAGNLKGLRIDGSMCCLDCREPIPPWVINGKARRPPLRCRSCATENWIVRDVLSGKSACGGAVYRARKDGLLRPPGDFACQDCGKQAEVYDHRDYNRPLDVAPVCRSCNVMRGSAVPFNQFLVGLLLCAEADRKAA